MQARTYSDSGEIFGTQGGIGSVLIDRPTNLPGLKHFQANFKVSRIFLIFLFTYAQPQVSGSGALAPTREELCPSSWFKVDKAVSDPGFCKLVQLQFRTFCDTSVQELLMEVLFHLSLSSDLLTVLHHQDFQVNQLLQSIQGLLWMLH